MNLCNWLPDSGASSHMMPHLADLMNVEEEQNFSVEVADSHIVPCTAKGQVLIHMVDDAGSSLQATLHDVIYVPGLWRCLFSVTAFTNQGHNTVLRCNEICLVFGALECPLTIPLANGISLASNAIFKITSDMPPNQCHDKKCQCKQVAL